MSNSYSIRLEGNKVFMCCGKAGCPSVEIDQEGLVNISDDFGGCVKMKPEEAELIKGAIEKLAYPDEEQ